MAALCIFCGMAPESKTKEHIFPQWLLKMTGFHSKNTSVGSNWATGKEIVFPGKNYTFPACDSCNNQFSDLEGKVKSIVERLCEDVDVSGTDLELLLDWFDKIRAGAWLGVSYMNKEVFGLPPNHYIRDRIGVKDRYLSVTNTYLPEKTFKWSGVNSLTFMASPTALMLRVNNLVFVNASTDFLVSESVGFPHPDTEFQTPGSNIANFNLLPGTGNVTADCFTTKPYLPSHIIRQPIFKSAHGINPDFYDNDHVINNSHDLIAGIGKLFLQNNQGAMVLEREDRVGFQMDEAKSVYGRVQVVRPILELQLEMLRARWSRLRFVSEEERDKQFMAVNKIIEYTNEQIQQYNY
ncbi:hypothetical protein [Pseudomonas sp. KB_12]|uniref:hypothetical protein n=1 Tax=Pseudomonas sp. KB_12 TaxID=3233034 RepID=UPI003F99427B